MVADRPFRDGNHPVNEPGSCVPEVLRRLLVHEGRALFILERTAVDLQDAGGHARLGGLCRDRLLAGGDRHRPPCVSRLEPAALGSPDLPHSGGNHVDDGFQLLLVVHAIPGDLPLVYPKGKVTIERRRPFQADLRGVERHHEALRIPPGGQGSLEACSLPAFGVSPVINEEDPLADYPEKRGGEGCRQNEPELVPLPVRLHRLDPPFHAPGLHVRRRHCFLRRVDVQDDPVLPPGDEPLPLLPSEGRSRVHDRDIHVGGFQGIQVFHYVLGVLAVHGDTPFPD